MRESYDTSRVATQELLNVTFREIAPGTCLCVMVGEVDLLTGPTLREKLNASNVEPSHLVIDLSAVQFLASIGLNILVEVLAAQEAAGRHLALVIDDNPAVTRTLESTGLDQVFDLHTERESAVRACPPPTDSPPQQGPQPEVTEH